MLKVFFDKGHVPHNKIVLTAEEESYLRDNYATKSNVEMAAKLKIHPKTVLRMRTRMGLKRTPEQIALICNNKKKRDIVKWRLKVQKIEGGGRENSIAKYHLLKWIEKNRPFSRKKILVYKNSDFKNYDDLILIFKRHYEDFLVQRENRRLRKIRQEKEKVEKAEKRDARLLEKSKVKEQRSIEKAKKQEKLDDAKKEREIKLEEKRKIQEKKNEEIKQKAIAKAAVRSVTLKKRQDEEDREKRFEEIKASRPKSVQEANLQLIKEDKVPIKVDHRTTVWVSKSKCEIINGEWVKKTPLNIVLQEEINNKPKKHERKKGLLDKVE
jgi:hypothetical protein